MDRAVVVWNSPRILLVAAAVVVVRVAATLAPRWIVVVVVSFVGVVVVDGVGMLLDSGVSTLGVTPKTPSQQLLHPMYQTKEPRVLISSQAMKL
jgi:hypothetical protein